jgi:hypothetical protein
MAKKKNKLSFTEQQKKLQLQRTQYKNLFIQKLRELCAAIGDPKLFNLIPESEQRRLYHTRCAPLKIRAAKGAKIQKRLMEVMEIEIKRVVNSTSMEMIPESGRYVFLNDYFLVGNVLEFVLTEERCEIKQKERFAEFVKHTQARSDLYFSTVRGVCRKVCSIYSDIIQHKRPYTFSFEVFGCEPEERQTQVNSVSHLLNTRKGRSMGMKLLDDVDMRIHPLITIDTIPLELKQLQVDGEKRSTTRLSTVYYGKDEKAALQHINIRLKTDNADDVGAPPPTPIYVQQHALMRLVERTGFKVISYAMIQLNICVLLPVIHKLSGNRFLLEYTIEGLKVGYFLCERVDDYVLIRTFLFLTNRGTPEGDKLAQLTNLQKADREYLSIDNLSTLLGSDITENEAICKLFRKAGCQSILDLCEKAKDNASLQDLLGIQKQTKSLSNLLMEYLNPQADNDEYVVGE